MARRRDPSAQHLTVALGGAGGGTVYRAPGQPEYDLLVVAGVVKRGHRALDELNALR
jgi:hypothetical protein